MCSQQELTTVLTELSQNLRALFGRHLREVILFGSYAHGDADDGSDVDVMVLVDLSREGIVGYRRNVAEISGKLLLTHNVLISPIVENQAFFARYCADLLFYRSINREGVRLSA